MEFKKNRQAAILESVRGLETPKAIPPPAIFSDAKATKALQKNRKRAEELIEGMRARLAKILEHPATYDPDSLNLTREGKTDVLFGERRSNGLYLVISLEKRAIHRWETQ